MPPGVLHCQIKTLCGFQRAGLSCPPGAGGGASDPLPGLYGHALQRVSGPASGRRTQGGRPVSAALLLPQQFLLHCQCQGAGTDHP